MEISEGVNFASSDLLRWNLLQNAVNEKKIKDVFSLFRDAKIEPVLIKGWAAARNYPPGAARRTGDIDIAVSSESFDNAYTLCRSEAGRQHFIDLHNELRNLDSVEFGDLIQHSLIIPVDDVDIRILCPEDHLRVLATHWLIDGGQYKDKLWDIYYAVENRPADFDWDRCLNIVSETRRQWVLLAIAIAHKYLGLKVDDLPFAEEVREVPAWVALTIEEEWKTDVRLQPVLAYTREPKQLYRQIRRRIPPNPIRCTIEMEGRFDYGRRRYYQAAVLAKRTFNFARQLPRAIISLVKND